MDNLKSDEHYLSNLFPTKASLFIFLSYIILFVNQGILVTASKSSDNKYNYNVTQVVLFTELVKLVMAICIYLKEKKLKNFKDEFISGQKTLLLYFVPAFLYCLYNNLAYFNLARMDPTTYYLLLQFRVVITGIIYEFLFKKKLNRWQWFSLCLLTIGCIIKQFGHSSKSLAKPNTSSTPSSVEKNDFFNFQPETFFNFNLFTILLQIFCSCFAGVYNEYLLKGQNSSKIHIMVQNFYMYLDSIVCNIFLLYLLSVYFEISGEKNKTTSSKNEFTFLDLFKFQVFSIIINNALCGIITSIFLKNFNSILKTFAAALELVFIAILCWIFFGIEIDIYTAISIFIVSYSTYLYSQNPIINVKAREEIKYKPLFDEEKNISVKS